MSKNVNMSSLEKCTNSEKENSKNPQYPEKRIAKVPHSGPKKGGRRMWGTRIAEGKWSRVSAGENSVKEGNSQGWAQNERIS